MLEEKKSSFSSACLPKLIFKPSSANLRFATLRSSSETIPSEREGAITRASSPFCNFLGNIICIGGRGGIRTHEALSSHGFPSRSVRPLRHPSCLAKAYIKQRRTLITVASAKTTLGTP